MRMRLPTSRGSFQFRLSVVDTVWAFVAPWLALLIRDDDLLAGDKLTTSGAFSAIAFVASILAFVAFRIRDGLTRYFSVHDALNVARAVVMAELLTFVALFTATRLDGIPRATPFIHALVLAAGLVAARIVARIYDPERYATRKLQREPSENIIMIGSNRASSLYISLLEACAPDKHRVIGVLDDQPGMKGRSVSNVRVLGKPAELLTIINEFAEHGITTHRVIVGGDADFLPEEVMDEIDRVCALREVAINFLPALIGLNVGNVPPANGPSATAESEPQSTTDGSISSPTGIAASKYFRFKRLPDVVIASILVVALLPVLLVVSCVVLFDVGSPIMFWQQRLGVGGRTFLLHKFRSLKPSYDWRGLPIPFSDRESWVGRMLRRSRLDELPQLLNILTGDMSLVGPRPLLPADQPQDPTTRLMIRPGITGWAQVNGGTLLTPQEKEELDEWYIQNVSPWLDLRILIMTALMLMTGERRSEKALAQARAARTCSDRPS